MKKRKEQKGQRKTQTQKKKPREKQKNSCVFEKLKKIFFPFYTQRLQFDLVKISAGMLPQGGHGSRQNKLTASFGHFYWKNSCRITGLLFENEFKDLGEKKSYIVSILS